MRSNIGRVLTGGAYGLAWSVLMVAGVAAQGRLVLPEGSVIIVRTTSPLESATAKVGQTFETAVADDMGVDNYTVIPGGSRIRGVVTLAQPATRQRSGVIEVNFDRLTLPDGSTLPISGKLTSTDAAERRQIETDPNARVVLVGGRGGIGAAIAGAGSQGSSTSNFLAALGSMLSEARDVRVPAGTPLAVQLEQRLVLSRRGNVRPPDANTIYTAEDRIRAAQQALARQNYYRGSVNGQIDDATRRALFEFQIDKGITATGNLDGRTADALGLRENANVAEPSSSAAFSPEDAALLRRAAQALAGRQRQDLGVATTGRGMGRRNVADADVDLWFALSAFADNASLYEQLVRSPASAGPGGKALISAAWRVDGSMQKARASAQVQSAWNAIRQQLAQIDPAYR